MNGTDARIVVRGVQKTFPAQPRAIAVLDGIDLEVGNGEFVAIVGPSGCGKTTLLNCIAGFERVDDGTIEVDGVPVAGPSPRRVFVFQDPAIFPWLNVGENIAFGLPRTMAATDRRAIVERYVDLVGLKGFEDAYPNQLSGGMKQRVEYARALAVDPDVLYLDEPFGALDALTRHEMRREIARIRRATGKTCLLVTHDVEEACELADRIAVMSPRPAKIREVFDNALPHPRDPDGEDLRALRVRIFAALGSDRRV
ncbi:MAG: ABC transporter ATP-binding protein [Planctomycetes bacterium]|nr:ABC transporter ATP-binding protein [Planctomycetota bacterium]MBI3846233.1 ABC transporter ATP-binding protein [Planctomycetota bacterium]